MIKTNFDKDIVAISNQLKPLKDYNIYFGYDLERCVNTVSVVKKHKSEIIQEKSDTITLNVDTDSTVKSITFYIEQQYVKERNVEAVRAIVEEAVKKLEEYK